MKTRSLHELAEGLRLMADMFDEAELELGALAAPVSINLYVSTEFASNDEARKQAIDQLALITGQDADWDKNSGDGEWAYWSTRLESASPPISMTAKAYVKRPNPADELRAENERLRAELAALKAAERGTADEAEHFHAGGAAGGPGENEAMCTCGVTFAGFDAQAEALAALVAHIANPEAAEPECAEVDDDEPAFHQAMRVEGVEPDFDADADADAAAEPDADGDLIAPADYTDPPRYPKGTPEYDAYAAELRVELDKFTHGERLS
jgi:hypothetical protein